MLRLRVFVTDVTSVLLSYNRVEIGRAANAADAASQSGTFASLGNVITLVGGTEGYSYTDVTGAVGQWYVSRYVASGGTPSPGSWSDPFEGAVMGALTAAEFRDYDLADLTGLVDDQVDRHIATATRLCEAEAGTSWALTSSNERHPWRAHSRRIYPYYRPIVAVTALRVDVSATQYATFNPANVYVNVDANYIEVSDMATAAYSLLPSIVSYGLLDPVANLTYTHGYATYPEFVKTAVALTTASVLSERALLLEGIGPDIASFHIGDYSVTRKGKSSVDGGGGLEVPAAAKKLLARYTNVSLR